MIDKNVNDNLLKRFNEREPVAFGEVYDSLYNELHYFTTQLYRDTPFVAADVMHDLFLELWQKRGQKFADFINIKAYFYVCIKNRFKNDVNHKKYIRQHHHEVLTDERSFISNIIETETISTISCAIDLLPAECAKVFRMHLDGWNVKEIAATLGKSQSTVYNQRQEAINILKDKISMDSLSLFIIFFGI